MNLIKKCRYGLMIYNDKDVWVGKSFALYGEYSESEVQLFADFIGQGMVVIDVGANTGSHTIALARLVGNTGVVFAYEPERLNFNTLAGNVTINNLHNVYVLQKAVGNINGTIAVPELDVEWTDNFGGLTLDADYRESPNYPVPIITLDSQNFNKCDFIKIDIEGMELQALEGAKELINKHKPVLYVENDRENKSKALIEYIKSLDYEIYHHNAPLFNPNNFFENKNNVFASQENNIEIQIVSGNVFCYHKSKPCPINVDKYAMKKL